MSITRNTLYIWYGMDAKWNCCRETKKGLRNLVVMGRIGSVLLLERIENYSNYTDWLYFA